MMHSKKIGLFGGTFDPIHLGHVHLASLAKEALHLDEVLFIPCYISPHKTAAPTASPAQRVQMLMLALADLPWAKVEDYELVKNHSVFSYETAKAMTEKFPSARLFWIMGGDQWLALDRWWQPERLAGMVEFAVLPRGLEALPTRQGYKLHVITGGHPASATEIRGNFSRRTWLQPNVVEFIQMNRLYHKEEGTIEDNGEETKLSADADGRG